MEDPNNIRLLCPHHSLKPNPAYADLPLVTLQGLYCKLTFPCPDGNKEYMWVLVFDMAETKGEELRAILDNDPVKATEFHCGDVIEFSRTEIIEIIE